MNTRKGRDRSTNLRENLVSACASLNARSGMPGHPFESPAPGLLVYVHHEPGEEWIPGSLPRSHLFPAHLYLPKNGRQRRGHSGG